VETAEDLAKRENRLRVLTQAIDTTSPGGLERELILERTHAGLAQAKAPGRCGGRKPATGPVEIKRAKAMLADPTITAEEVAQQLGGSHRRSTGTYQAVAAS
jgi:DNA invertase Pin-like site-specific DNA recombinase